VYFSDDVSVLLLSQGINFVAIFCSSGSSGQPASP